MEYKFKVWDKILKCWSKNTMSWYHNADGTVSPETGDRYVFDLLTNFEDKNSKRIFENDLVRVGFKRELGIIIFENGKFQIDYINRLIEPEDLCECLDDDLEKIGNTHENPELLEY